MASAEVVVSTVKELKNVPQLDRYDENLCADIQKKLDQKLREKEMSISEKALFVSFLLEEKVFNKK